MPIENSIHWVSLEFYRINILKLFTLKQLSYIATAEGICPKLSAKSSWTNGKLSSRTQKGFLAATAHGLSSIIYFGHSVHSVRALWSRCRTLGGFLFWTNMYM